MQTARECSPVLAISATWSGCPSSGSAALLSASSWSPHEPYAQPPGNESVGKDTRGTSGMSDGHNIEQNGTVAH